MAHQGSPKGKWIHLWSHNISGNLFSDHNLASFPNCHQFLSLSHLQLTTWVISLPLHPQPPIICAFLSKLAQHQLFFQHPQHPTELWCWMLSSTLFWWEGGVTWWHTWTDSHSQCSTPRGAETCPALVFSVLLCPPWLQPIMPMRTHSQQVT